MNTRLVIEIFFVVTSSSSSSSGIAIVLDHQGGILQHAQVSFSGKVCPKRRSASVLRGSDAAERHTCYPTAGCSGRSAWPASAALSSCCTASSLRCVKCTKSE